MAGLYYRHGTMSASKTANLIMIGHNYEEQGFKVLYLKPAIDTREGIAKNGQTIIRSRVGIQKNAIAVDINTQIETLCVGADIVMVDEAQFLTKEQVDDLWEISCSKVVMCFGLLTDFKRELFPGSKRLIEIADSVQEIKSICACGKRALINARFENGKIILKGAQVAIEGEAQYRALCRECYIVEKRKLD